MEPATSEWIVTPYHRCSTKSESSGKGSGGLAGEFAHRAWRTLDEGEILSLAGTAIRFRTLDDTGARDSRVHVFRNGMWITSNVTQFSPAMFSGHRPFDAVLLLEQGELYDLVCAAEGPEHRGIAARRLGTRQERDRLSQLLRELRDGLRSRAGELTHPEQFAPPEFAVVRGDTLRVAERVHRRRPRHAPEGGVGATVPGSDGQILPVGRGDRVGSSQPRTGGAPAAGRAAAIQTTVMPRRDGRGGIAALSVRWRFRDDPPPAAVGVRVVLPSGSDQTCEQPLRPDWVSLAEILDMDGEVLAAAPPDTGATELVIPPKGDGIAIRLFSPLAPDATPALDVVRRSLGGD